MNERTKEIIAAFLVNTTGNEFLKNGKQKEKLQKYRKDFLHN